MKYITVKCGYRIHINSIDMNGFSGRGCGGLGFCLANPFLEVSVAKIDNNKNIIKAKYKEKINKILEMINNSYNLNSNYKVIVKNEIKEHIGLGSETQMIFALTCAILKLHNKKILVDKIAEKLQLAGVSGIGYGTYKYGKFIVDSGYIMGENKKNFVAHSAIPPKILCNYSIPKNWKVLLVIPKKITSISDEEENNFFSMYTPVPEDEVKQICYYTFMGVLPAILEKDFDHFIKSLNIITKLGTKKAEIKINENNTKHILEQMEKDFNFSAISSLGPTCYTFIDIKNKNIDLNQLKKKYKNCDVILTDVKNTGFELKEEENE